MAVLSVADLAPIRPRVSSLEDRAFIRSESGSFGVNLYCLVVAEVPCALLPVLGTPNAARFMTIMTGAKTNSPIINPMADVLPKYNRDPAELG
jgi:hypothetical protein